MWFSTAGPGSAHFLGSVVQLLVDTLPDRYPVQARDLSLSRGAALAIEAPARAAGRAHPPLFPGLCLRVLHCIRSQGVGWVGGTAYTPTRWACTRGQAVVGVTRTASWRPLPRCLGAYWGAIRVHTQRADPGIDIGLRRSSCWGAVVRFVSSQPSDRAAFAPCPAAECIQPGAATVYACTRRPEPAHPGSCNRPLTHVERASL